MFAPIGEHLGFQRSCSLKSRNVEMGTCQETKDISVQTEAADAAKALILGFQVQDDFPSSGWVTSF